MPGKILKVILRENTDAKYNIAYTYGYRYFDAEVARCCTFFVQGFPSYEIGRQRLFPPMQLMLAECVNFDCEIVEWVVAE